MIMNTYDSSGFFGKWCALLGNWFCNEAITVVLEYYTLMPCKCIVII